MISHLQSSFPVERFAIRANEKKHGRKRNRQKDALRASYNLLFQERSPRAEIHERITERDRKKFR